MTPRWLASDECFGEFTATWYAGQRIVPLLAADPTALDKRQHKRLGRVLGKDQGFDLSRALKDGRLDLDTAPEIADPFKAGLRAAGALAKIGLDPRSVRSRSRDPPSPFPGLQSFGDTDADAAVFYGRSPEIANCWKLCGRCGHRRAPALRHPRRLRLGQVIAAEGRRAAPTRRERGWLVLRTFRPGADPLFNFAETIAQSVADYGETRAPGTLRDSLRTKWDEAERQGGFATADGLKVLRQMLESEVFERLRGRANRLGATVPSHWIKRRSWPAPRARAPTCCAIICERCCSRRHQQTAPTPPLRA